MYALLAITRLAEIIDEFECRPISSMFMRISPYWFEFEEEPTVMFSELPMLVFLAALLESTKVSSMVFSDKLRSSKSIEICP